MKKKIEEPISELLRKLTEVKRRPLSSFVSIETVRQLHLNVVKEDDESARDIL